MMIDEIGFGGGCHWCTEAVFQSLLGVSEVEQGWIGSTGEKFAFSEAVIVKYDPNLISLNVLIEIHLHTHKSTSNHSMRDKYRSAIYVYSKKQKTKVEKIINSFQEDFENKLVTKVLSFSKFKPSREQIKHYYYKNPKKPFCETFINPKLKLLLQKFAVYTNKEKLNHLLTT